jgi:hypothetical protein
MKLILEPTDIIQSVEGQPCRLWKGESDKGVPVHAFIRAVSPQTHDPEANAEFARELQELPKARREAVTFDLRFFVD